MYDSAHSSVGSRRFPSGSEPRGLVGFRRFPLRGWEPGTGRTPNRHQSAVPGTGTGRERLGSESSCCGARCFHCPVWREADEPKCERCQATTYRDAEGGCLAHGGTDAAA